MSEPKAYIVYTPREGVVEGLWKSYSVRIEGVEVYLKSEADKVIAEKDKQIEELKHQRDGALGLANSGLTLEDLTKLARKEIDRQKYKRCLTMAAICAKEVESREYLVYAVKGAFEKYTLYKKWRNRWLELAEKFKEAK